MRWLRENLFSNVAERRPDGRRVALGRLAAADAMSCRGSLRRLGCRLADRVPRDPAMRSTGPGVPSAPAGRSSPSAGSSCSSASTRRSCCWRPMLAFALLLRGGRAGAVRPALPRRWLWLTAAASVRCSTSCSGAARSGAALRRGWASRLGSARLRGWQGAPRGLLAGIAWPVSLAAPSGGCSSRGLALHVGAVVRRAAGADAGRRPSVRRLPADDDHRRHRDRAVAAARASCWRSGGSPTCR